VARRAHEVGLGAIALTDHDTTEGVPAAASAGAALGLRVIPGCEFSVRAPWGELHLLGYFLTPGDPALEAFLRETRAARRRRGEQMIDKLQHLGVDIDLEDVTDQVGAEGALGRPHVARALVEAGAVVDISEAFYRFLGRGRPAYVEKPLPALAQVAEIVHAVGGLAVAAHLGDHGTENQLRQFKAQGMDGIEVRHPSHAPATEARLTQIAGRLDLGICGGSDWHGDRELGATHAPLGGMDVPAAWLEDLERRRGKP
jgi:predicted metal-dependent phosphoesterase TrpH